MPRRWWREYLPCWFLGGAGVGALSAWLLAWGHPVWSVGGLTLAGGIGRRLYGKRPWQAAVFFLLLAVFFLREGREEREAGWPAPGPGVFEGKVFRLREARWPGDEIGGLLLQRWRGALLVTPRWASLRRGPGEVPRVIQGVLRGRGVLGWESSAGKISLKLFLAEVEEQAVPGLRERFLADLRERLSPALRDEPRNFLLGLVFGASGNMDRKSLQAFQDAGVVHFLAVSGMNVAMVVVLLTWVTARLGVGPEWRFLLVLNGILLYSWLCGGQPSVFRAAAMAILWYGGRMLGRPTRMVNTLALAALLYWGVDPGAGQEIGFQLSYLAVLVLAVRGSVSWETGEVRWWREIKTSLAISLSIWLVTWPVASYHFGRVCLVALVATPILLLPMTVLFYGALGVLALCWLPPGLLAYPARCWSLLADFSTGLCRLLSSIPGGMLEYRCSVAVLAGYYIVLGWAWLAFRSRKN